MNTAHFSSLFFSRQLHSHGVAAFCWKPIEKIKKQKKGVKSSHSHSHVVSARRGINTADRHSARRPSLLAFIHFAGRLAVSTVLFFAKQARFAILSSLFALSVAASGARHAFDYSRRVEWGGDGSIAVQIVSGSGLRFARVCFRGTVRLLKMWVVLINDSVLWVKPPECFSPLILHLLVDFKVRFMFYKR